MDWRDSRAAKIVFYVLVGLGWWFWSRKPPSITPWQNIFIDAVLIAAVVWMAWPVFKRVTTPRDHL